MSNMFLENSQQTWIIVKVRDVIESLQPGFACGKRDDEGYFQLRMNNIGLEGKVVTNSLLKVPKSETNIEKYRLQKGDIIFNNTNSPELVGKTILFNDEVQDCVYSNHLTRIRVNRNLTTPEFVTHYLRMEQRKGTFQLLCRRFVGQAAVPRESLLNLDFPLLPINEQKRIVNKIEELFRESRTTQQALDKIPEIMKKFRQSILSSAFRGELVPQDPNDEPAEKLLQKIREERKKNWEEELRVKGKDPKKFKYEESAPVETASLSELPNGWIWIKLHDICNEARLVDPRKEPKKEITYVDISAIDNETNSIVDIKKMFGKHAPSRARQQIMFNDILFSTVRTYLKNIAMVNNIYGNPICSTGFCVIRPIFPIESHYIFYHVLTDYFINKVTPKQTGTLFPAARESDIMNQVIPLPPINEQKRIVAKIKELFSFADQIEKSVEGAEKRANKIDQAILAKAFRGELVPQDPNDEPASVLLERIKQEKKSVMEQTSVKQRRRK